MPPRSFFAQLGIPRSVRRQAFFGDPASRQALRDMFSDTRMLCHEIGLMNPVALVMWKARRIGAAGPRDIAVSRSAGCPTSVSGTPPTPKRPDPADSADAETLVPARRTRGQDQLAARNVEMVGQ